MTAVIGLVVFACLVSGFVEAARIIPASKAPSFQTAPEASFPTSPEVALIYEMGAPEVIGETNNSEDESIGEQEENEVELPPPPQVEQSKIPKTPDRIDKIIKPIKASRAQPSTDMLLFLDF